VRKKMPKARKPKKNKPPQKKQSLVRSKKTEKGSSSGTCPIGSHWVKAHPLTVPPSKKNPIDVTTRRAHCARNSASSSVPFSFDGDTVYPYWKCYSTKDASLHCDDPDYDEDEKSLVVILSLEIRSQNDGSHDYLTRRAIRLESCKYFQNEFNKITKGESNVCVSGEFWKKNPIGTGNAEMIWSFDKFKTTKGCVSYFAGNCDLSVQLEQGCKPKE
jgi:hypothetical protein